VSRPDNTRYLRSAQATRRDRLIGAARDALRRLDTAGETITVAAVVRASGTSRAFIYRIPELVAEIQQLRARQADTGQRVPARQRASDASNHARIRHLTDTNRQLRAENQRLRDQNAAVLGKLRERAVTAPTALTIGAEP
jgi:hypothetical protein